MVNDCRPALLSPAGNWEALKAAVSNGADAVYLGTKRFNARIFSHNFDISELKKVCDYAHKHGVRVYLTLNILIKNHEIKEYFESLSQAYVSGIDGVIIQHLSFVDHIKNNFPGLKVFVSTQAAVSNIDTASLVRSADRIILPRELTFPEIKQFCQQGFHVEVFIHGALCFSYSGLCLFSSFVSNRSGNRGSCAQLCRQKYNSSYPLSTRELCLVNKIPDLLKLGIKGFKIEGRMRSPLYVAVATRLYRKAIDSALTGNFQLPPRDMEEMEIVFNREFTEGLMFGDNNLVSPEKPMNRGAFLGEVRKGKILLQHDVSVGDGIGIWYAENVTGDIIHNLMINGKNITTARAGESIILKKSLPEGARIHVTSSPKISIRPDFNITRPSVVPAPERRKITYYPPLKENNVPATGNPEFLVKVYSLQEARDALVAGAHTAFLNIFSPDYHNIFENFNGGIMGAYIPRILNQAELNEAVSLLNKWQPRAILLGNPGILNYRLPFPADLYADYSFNTFNDVDIEFLYGYSVIPIMSPELSLSELCQLRHKNVILFCHGDIIVVNTRINPECDSLVDEHNNIFRIRQEYNYYQILNSRPFGLFEDIKKFIDAGFRKFFIDYENKSPEYISLYISICHGNPIKRKLRKGYTSGHLYKPVL